MPGPLGIKDDVKLTDEQRWTLQYIEDFDLSDELQAAQMKGYFEADEREVVERELKRFFALGYLEETGPVGPPAKLDGPWHQLILNTRRYHEFCYRVYSGYRHHVPAEVGESGVPPERVGEMLRRYFDDVPEEVWKGRRCICFTAEFRSGRKG